MDARTDQFLTSSSLAELADFRLGEALIRPSLRRIEGPAAAIMVEPRVMQVLIALHEAEGAVVSRDALARRCWGGAFVSDDSLNRAISETRRALKQAGAEDAGIETIPRTGHRLVVKGAPTSAPAAPPEAAAPERRFLSRRLAITALATAAIGAAGLALWRSIGVPTEAERLLDRSAAALLGGETSTELAVVGAELVSASRLHPDHVALQARTALVLAWQLDAYDPDRAAASIPILRETATRALAADPDHPEALAALALEPPPFGDWLKAERRLRTVLRRHPDQVASLHGLARLFEETGRLTEALALYRRLVVLHPDLPWPLAQQVSPLLALGRTEEADSLGAATLARWPDQPSAQWARLWFLLATREWNGAAALLPNTPLPPRAPRAIEATILAFRTGHSEDRLSAIAQSRALGSRGQSGANNAVKLLGLLDARDDAFELLDGWLLGRGGFVVNIHRTPENPTIMEQRRRNTGPLFSATTALLRSDPRFLPLCRDVGLAGYWHGTGARPDFLGSQPLPA